MSWVCKHLFPPSIRTSYSLDRLFEEAEEESREQWRRFPVRWYTYNRYHILDLRQAEPESPEGVRSQYHACDKRGQRESVSQMR